MKGIAEKELRPELQPELERPLQERGLRKGRDMLAKMGVPERQQYGPLVAAAAPVPEAVAPAGAAVGSGAGKQQEQVWRSRVG